MRRLVAVAVLALVALLSGLATGFALYYYLFYFLLAAVVLNLAWSWLNARGIQVIAQRQVIRAQVGDYVESQLAVQNTSLLPKLAIEIRDLVALPGQVTGRIFNLWPRQTARWRPRTPLLKRGLYPLGPIHIESADVFGLFRRRVEVPAAQEILVYPRSADLPLFEIPQIESIHEGVARHRTPVVTPLAASIRDYTPNDSYKRIHWPSSVRTGRLMVKEFETDQGTRFWIVLDLERKAQAGGEVENTEEYGVTIALSLAKKYLALNWPVGLVALGDQEYLLQAERGLGSLAHVLDMLAVVRAEGNAPLGEVLSHYAAWIRAPSTLVVITPSADPAWVGALAPVVRRKVHAAAVLLDTSSFGGGESAEALVPLLLDQRVLTYVVRQGDELERVLAYPRAVRPAAYPAMIQ